MQTVRLVGVGCAEIGREVDDKLSMYDEVVIRLLQISGKHLCQAPQNRELAGMYLEGAADMQRKTRKLLGSSMTHHHHPFVNQ